MAARAPTAASPDRAAGALLLRHAGCDLFLMDDGFQSAQLQPDLALLVVDGATGLATAHLSRRPLARAAQRSMAACRRCSRGRRGRAGRCRGAPCGRRRQAGLSRAPSAVDAAGLRGARCLAFAGIANPGKFQASLEEVGATVETRRDFPDHHPFTEGEAHALLRDAEARGLVPVTTAKDHVRLLAGGPQARLLGEAAGPPRRPAVRGSGRAGCNPSGGRGGVPRAAARRSAAGRRARLGLGEAAASA